MRFSFINSILFSAILLGACSGGQESGSQSATPIPSEVPDGNANKASVPDSPPEYFGASFYNGVTFVEFDELVANPDQYVGNLVETAGRVRLSCLKRGCWMEVRSPSDVASRGITVRFKNYGFFVPIDSRGAWVRFQGKISLDILTKEEISHMESEGATLVKELDGTAKVLTFIAIGVEMRDRIK